MILLVSGATTTVRRLSQHTTFRPYLGQLLTPQNGNDLNTLVATGLPIGVDNAAYSNWDERAWQALCRALESAFFGRAARHWASSRRLLWVACPDVPGDARDTLYAWKWFYHQLRGRSLPIAFVAQDGCEDPALRPSFYKYQCLFVGGSTEWKLGKEAARLIREAKARGKWVHIGRVNSARRERYFAALGADSFDGTQYSMFPDRYIAACLRRLARPAQQGIDEVLWAA